MKSYELVDKYGNVAATTTSKIWADLICLALPDLKVKGEEE